MKANKAADARIHLVDQDGARVYTLRKTARELIISAETRASNDAIRTSEAVDRVVREAIAQSGMEVTPLQVHSAVKRLDAMRMTACYEELELLVQSAGRNVAPRSPMPDSGPRSTPESTPEGVFEPERRYPDPAALGHFNRLAGIDAEKRALLTELELSVAPSRMEEWSLKHHATRETTLLTAYHERVPLVVLAGDVGTGKTALAESVGAALVDQGTVPEVRLLKLTGQVRGNGLVGDLSRQVNDAFAYAERRAMALGPTIPLLLLVDEADAIATTRAEGQMHHEDKAGVNALLQRLDRLKRAAVRPTVLFITNRPGDVDPAIGRRAGLVLKFKRPNLEARAAIYHSMLDEYGFSARDIAQLATLSGARAGQGPSFTASDIIDKVLARALEEAVRTERPLTVKGILAVASSIDPSPEFGA